MEDLVPVRLPSLANLTFFSKVLIDGDGMLTPQGWGASASVVSALLCFMLYKFSRPFSAALFSSYSKLAVEDRRNWDSRYSSNLHAAACVVCAYLMLVQSDFFWRESTTPLILRTCAFSYMAMGISFGYFAVDFVSCIRYNMGGTEMLLHHLGSLLSVATALYTGDGHLHTLWMLVTEFTTPLINNRWWLDKMDLKHHRVYLINGLAILVCWICARLALFPPFFWLVWVTRHEIKQVTPLSQVLVAVVPLILTILNWYWFVKIVKGAYKAFMNAGKQKQA